MRILFHLAHPAQYHMFKHVIRNLTKNGHTIKITINTKDILEQLLIADGVQYENILPIRRKRNNKFSTLLTLVKKDIQIFKVQLLGNYDLLVGTETALSHVGWLFRKPTLIMDEDDITLVPQAAKISFPFAKHIVSPVSCYLGKYSKKKIEYNGFQKIAYLHPLYFTPDEKIVEKILSKKERYFLIRISDLSAYHDNGKNGFTEEIIRRIISLLTPIGKVLLSTERKLPDDLNHYQFKTEVTNIHHFLYFADLLIADSQSMCVEAAMLGTPSIRFSDFAGKIGVLEELEHKYGLTFGIKVSEEDKLFEKLEDLLQINNIRMVWQQKRHNMLEDKIDVTSFWTWLIGNYPDSLSVLKENPEFQDTFRQ
jgi:uncharacterized protein